MKMALETLSDVKEIGGFEIGRVNQIKNENDFDGYDNYRDALKKFVIINCSTNTIAFKIQNGPIKEVGVNGCQIDTMIEAVKLIIEGLNRNFPCEENQCALDHLIIAWSWLKDRKLNREKRGVEGFNKE
jgi:hypothetical protein